MRCPVRCLTRGFFPFPSAVSPSGIKQKFGHLKFGAADAASSAYQQVGASSADTTSKGVASGLSASIKNLGDLLEHMTAAANGEPEAAEAEPEFVYKRLSYGFNGSSLLHAAPALYEDFVGPGYLPLGPKEDDYTHRDFVFLGGAGSGLGVHRHWEAWNVVVHGEKRWFMYPPGVTPPLQPVRTRRAPYHEPTALQPAMPSAPMATPFAEPFGLEKHVVQYLEHSIIYKASSLLPPCSGLPACLQLYKTSTLP